ncbi:MAG: VanW family protein [Candidatus Gottesmanbacteria bacterium GW2011_GWB1_43_11]|uniref:VanW family protein n=1 Tax=Candidatus Gottesmanbacteria bacterium GW2011_GWB1_43_11 TaxID=1618446 RepID=A0A0G1CHK7_9BACT|nr:MAG: VanW family protein [Candidatus Gottesmanbacteria bacterium GW2011_GWA2_42_16]KKS53995.1 MAG: VanW family protein [Candidatus Gottesmanbacteria bacterium GW2011_GWA1_42_26]KKS80639.1 MAG: VanW family protein [Candidatus Gottesmanbacteria bacterium GW2011_GWC1_43_10]KKS84997.1 MAG: VanW family protein [Candidatus Gottesmanbacteria bacterium GW2011_GWB1_43_11]OGG09465.1 MAG: hypothetical protein A2699_05695 [Candidatus Gottesmanbacteria bacterium RIFCSPHIGHO2_01_FULL_43_15]OGG26087.1 MAG
MPKIKPVKVPNKSWHKFLYFVFGVGLGLVLLITSAFFMFEKKYAERVYPGITIGRFDFSGQTSTQITNFWLNKNLPFNEITLTLAFENQIATVSGSELEAGFDATLSATQALDLGRSGHLLSDLYLKYTALREGINLPPLFRWKEEILNKTLDQLAQRINIAPENALFEFRSGRVTAFKPAKSGRVLETQQVKDWLTQQLTVLANQTNPETNLQLTLPVKTLAPTIDTAQANDLGITELIGQGESFFKGSIPGRIHNVALAASRINGVLIPPATTFSFNDTVGDISAATGYKQAYVIKNGRTVLDDGGGVCQVSTTLFRAALNAGLSIVERHAHSYRVGYYEQGGWKPGFDATVYAPSYDLKIKNDTPTYILIQAKTDLANFKLTFELYGVKDGRQVNISPVRLWDPVPPPPDLNQDDPTLPNGTIKQVDWAAPGIKASFDYRVTRGETELFKKTFYSNFIPWQAVYLKGTGPTQ